MKKSVSLLIMFTLLCSVLIGCNMSNNDTSFISSTENVSSAPQPFPVTVRDITIGTEPTRVVSLSPMLTDLICEYGYEDRLVGRSSNCMFSTTVLRLPDVGTAAEPKLEEIIKLSPEYVFTTQPLSEDAVMWLSKNNIAVITLERPSSIKELTGIYSDLTVIFEGKLDGLVKGAKKAQAFTDKLDELKLKIEAYRRDNGMDDAVSVMIIHSLDNYIAAGSTIENDILEHIGIGNAASDSKGYFVSDDALKSINPHLIAVSSNVDPSDLSINSLFKVKTAVKQDNIILIDTSLIEKCSVNMLWVFYDIAESMYPGVTDIDLSATPGETVSQ